MTNHELIKNMTVEEMAEFLNSKKSICDFCKRKRFQSDGVCLVYSSSQCTRGIKEFLEAEVEE